MGSLHDGHLALVDRAAALADRVVVSVFVTPLQFGPSEDFERYPRDEAGDSKLLASAGCDLLFAPERAVMYPEGFATSVFGQLTAPVHPERVETVFAELAERGIGIA